MIATQGYSAEPGPLCGLKSLMTSAILPSEQTLPPLKLRQHSSFDPETLPSYASGRESPFAGQSQRRQGDKFAPFGGCQAKLHAGLRRQELSCPLRALGNGFCQLHSHMAADVGEEGSITPQKRLHVSKSGTGMVAIRAWHPPILE